MLLNINPVADTYMRDGSYAYTNYGAIGYVLIKTSGTSYNRRALMRFSLSSLPAGSQISSVRLLTYWLGSSYTGGGTVSVYPCLRDWVENEATWNVYKSGSSWATAGAGDNENDYDGDTLLTGYTLSSAPSTGEEMIWPSSSNLVQKVQDNIGGEINMLLISSGDFNFGFYTKEASNGDYWPILEVTYTPCEMEDISLDLAAYYRKLENLQMFLRAHDGVELHDLQAKLEAFNLAVEDIGLLLSAYFESKTDVGMTLNTWATHYRDALLWLQAQGCKAFDFASYMAAAKAKLKDIACWLSAADGIILRDMAAWLEVTDGRVLKDIGLYLKVIKGVPTFRAVTAHRLSSVLSEVT